jgi:hypothetical protein
MEAVLSVEGEIDQKEEVDLTGMRDEVAVGMLMRA